MITGKVWKYGDDINTDVIFPGKYTYTISDRKEMAEHALEDLDPDFAKNVKKDDIIVAGKNFGCGSSREHAPWAIKDAGIDVVISSEFADIFKGNSEKNELLTIILSEEIVQKLLNVSDEFLELTIDLEHQKVIDTDKNEYPFEISSFSKKRFLEGISDLDYLLEMKPQVKDFEKKRKEMLYL